MLEVVAVEVGLTASFVCDNDYVWLDCGAEKYDVQVGVQLIVCWDEFELVCLDMGENGCVGV